MKIISRMGLCLFATALSLLSAEFGARVVFNRNGMHYAIEMWKYAKQMKRQSPIAQMGHEHVSNQEAVLMGVHVKINSQGLRENEYAMAKPEDTFRILVLGDSMTFGWGARFEETYAKVLERLLNEKRPAMQKGSASFHQYEVINAGVGNYNTVQEVTYFKKRGIAYKPDMVLLGFYLNDAEDIPKRSGGFLREHSYFSVLLLSLEFGQTTPLLNKL